MAMIALLLQVAVPPPRRPVPPPVIVVPTPIGEPTLQIAGFRGSTARCNGTAVAATHVEPVIPFASYGGMAGIAPVTLQFRIDARGRPVSIEGAAPNHRASDVMPSFAAWRFEPREERVGCSITFYPLAASVEETDDETLERYFAIGGGYGSASGAEAVRRMVPQESNCIQSWPQLLTQVTPRFDSLPGEPGTITTTNVAFDIDADGGTANVRTVGGEGNPALDRAAVEAVEQWRYAEGPRKGCVYPFWRSSSDALEAPERPKGGGPGCPLADGWQVAPRLQFPEAYKRRRIEGWALVGFDVAPWGQLGNLRVLHAEPTSQFGDAALSVTRSASKPKSGAGASNCQVMVQFKLDGDDAD